MVHENPRSKFVELRRKAGVTQKTLADALGVTDHTIRNWEKGREEPRLYVWQVKRMCELLHCSLADLPDNFKDIEGADSGESTASASDEGGN